MQALKGMHAATHTQNPEYLIYGHNHYNAVWHNMKIKTKGKNKIKERRKIYKLKIETVQHNKENWNKGNTCKIKKTKQIVKCNIKNK